MYLTRGIIPALDAAKNRITDIYKWHKFAWRLFPEDKQRDYLFRVDQKGRHFELYVLSPKRPTPMSVGSWETLEVSRRLLNATDYRFRVRLNPTRKVARFDTSGNKCGQGKRVPLWDLKDIEAYLERKASSHGFSLQTHTIDGPYKEVSFGKGGKHTHCAVDVQGVLTVTDREKFAETYRTGIGSSKGFGFGLLLLKKISR